MLLAAFLLVLVGVSNGQIPQKNITDNRAYQVGIVGLTLAQAASLTQCIQDDFWNQYNLSTIGSDFKNCAMQKLGAKLPTLMALYSQADSCLKGCNSSASQAGSIIGDVFTPDWTAFYNNMMKNFTTQKKKAKNSHDAVLNGGYAMFNKKYVRSHMNDLCKKIVAKMTTAQFKCVVTNAKSVVDVTTYGCAQSLKSGLVG